MWPFKPSLCSSLKCDCHVAMHHIYMFCLHTVLKYFFCYVPATWLTASFSCRCGFAGETGPRFIIPSEIRKPGQQHVRHHCALLSVIFFFFNGFLEIYVNVACDVSLLGHQSGSVQHQHRRALCHPQRVYPYSVLQVRLLY